MKKRWKVMISFLLVIVLAIGICPLDTLRVKAASETDAFGNPVDTSFDKEAKLNDNPYGTRGWVTVLEGSELYVAKGEGSTRNYNSYNYNDGNKAGSMDNPIDPKYSIGSKQESNKDAYTMMDTAAVDAAGEGQRRYVVNLGYHHKERLLKLFLTDKNGNAASNVINIGKSKTLDYLESCEAQYNTAFISVAAGDFNGDGKDTIIAYYPSMESDETPRIEEYSISKSGSTFSLTKKRNVIDNVYEKLGVDNLMKSCSYNPRVRRNAPVVQMVVGDTDKDARDELVLTMGMNNCYTGGVANRHSRVFVCDDLGTSWNVNNVLECKEYADGEKKGRLRWCSSAIGNVASIGGGVDYPEIVTAGWVDYNTSTSSDLTHHIGSYMTSCTKVEKDTLVGTYSVQAMPVLKDEKNKDGVREVSEFTSGGHYVNDHVNSQLPVAVFNAAGNKPANAQNDEIYTGYVLISDTVYAYDGNAWKYIYRDKYFDDKGGDKGINGYIISSGLVQDAVAGNFVFDQDAKEQVVFATCLKNNSVDRHFYKVYGYQMDAEGNWRCDTAGYPLYHASNAYLSLTAFDCDDDSIIARIKDVKKEYTVPDILAILEAPPYFGELEDGLGGGETVYGKSEGNGTSESNSDFLNTECSVGFEWEVDDASGGFGFGFGFELTVENNFTWSHSTTDTIEYELEYSNDTGENMVLVYTRPAYIYTYEVKDSSQKITIIKYDEPSTNMISVDKYNEIVEAHPEYKMETINENMLGTPGDPFSYRSSIEGYNNKWVAKDLMDASTKGTRSQTITVSKEEEDAFEYELSTLLKMEGKLAGIKAGFGAGYGYSEGSSTIQTSSISKSGSVTGTEEEGYGFQWKFGHWTQKINGTEKPILGYVVSNQCAPPSPPENLSSREITSTSAVLTWDHGSRRAEEYRIYQIYSDGSAVQIASVDGSETSYKLTKLFPDTTYTYAITSASNGVMVSGESVKSMEHTLTTVPDGLGEVQIVSPKNVNSRAGKEVSFSSSLTAVSDTYKATNYQWQKREKGGKWQNIAKANKSAYSFTASEEDHETEYRCVFKVAYSNATSLIQYYSGSAKLTIGADGTDVSLTVSGHDGAGQGTMKAPYTGTSDYQSLTGYNTNEIETKKNVTVSENGAVPELTVYELNKAYYGVGTKNGEAVYYTMNKNSGSYEAATEIKRTESKYYQDETGAPVTGLISAGRAAGEQITTGDASDPYYLVATVEGTAKPAAGSVKETRLGSYSGHTLYWFRDGSYYADNSGAVGAQVTSLTDTAKANLYDVFLNTDADKLFGRRESYAENEDGEAGETQGYIYTRIHTESTATAATTVSYLSYAESEKYTPSVGGGFPGTLTPVEETQVTQIKTPVYQTVAGTTLTLRSNVKEANTEKNIQNIVVDFVVTNVSTGVAKTISAATDASGNATAYWVAPTDGLYKIESSTRANSEYVSGRSDSKYYEASKIYDHATTEYKLVVLKDDAQVSGSITYGDTVTLQLMTRDALKDTNGNPVYTKWVDISGSDVAYQIDTMTSPLTGNAFRPENAGSYVCTVYEKDMAGAVTENILATAVIRVVPKKILISPDLEGKIPTSADQVKLVSDDDTLSKEEIEKFFVASSPYFAATDPSGSYDVTVDYKNSSGMSAEDKALMAKFKGNYDVRFERAYFTVSLGSAQVNFDCGENGVIQGKYSDHRYPFESGTLRSKGTSIEFDAVAATGYAVKEWTVNGEKYDPAGLSLQQIAALEKAGIKITNDGKKLSVAAFDPAVNAPEGSLNVFVDFVSVSNKIVYGVSSVPAGGTIAATEENGYALPSERYVENGASITITATPQEGYVVDHWIVNGKEYTWPGTSEIYRANEIRFEDIQSAVTALVYFKEAAKTHKVTVSVVNEDYMEGDSLADISVTDKENGTKVADLNAVTDGKALSFTAVVANTTNNTVKEWQTKTGDGDFTTLKGSGGMREVTIYNITDDLYVRAVVTSAQVQSVRYEVYQNGMIVTDEAVAKLTASTKGQPILSGTTVAAYIPIEFELTLNDDYYVTSWSGIAANAEDIKKASLEAVDKNLVVKVNIDEKPVVRVQTAVGGKAVAEGVYADAPKTIVSDNHVDRNTDLKVTYVPDAGYVVTPDASLSYADGSGKTTDNMVYTIKDITADRTITPAFTPLDLCKITYGVEINTGTEANGEITAVRASKKGMAAYEKEVGSGDSVYATSDVTFTANPSEDYRVKTWIVNGEVLKTDGIADVKNEITLTNIDEDTEVIVSFEHAGMEIIAEAYAHGKIVEASAAGMDQLENIATGLYLTNGTQLSLKAEADEGYQIDFWEVNGQKIMDGADVYVQSDYVYSTSDTGARIRVHFGPIAYDVNYKGTNAVVTVSGNDGPLSVTGGDTVTLAANVNKGYKMGYWTIDGQKVLKGDGSDYAEVTLDFTPAIGIGAKTYEIEAVAVANDYTVRYAQPQNGSLTAAAQSAAIADGSKVSAGTEVTFTATPDDGYLVTGWKLNGSATASKEESCKVTIKEDVDVEVILEPAAYTVSYEASGSGSVEGAKSGSQRVAGGAQITLTAQADTYYKVIKWTDENGNEITTGVSADKSTITLSDIQKNETVIAVFGVAVRYPVSYTVVSDDPNVTPASCGQVTGKIVDEKGGTEEILLEGRDTLGVGGSKVVFTITPNAGYMLSYVKQNGVILESRSNTFTLETLTKKADFEIGFTSYTGYDIPVTPADKTDASNCYTICDVVRTPDDTEPDTQIRKNGTVSFTVKPDKGMMIYSFKADGVECKGTGSSETAGTENVVTAVGKPDGSIAVTIKNVTKDITVETELKKIQHLKLEVQNNKPAYKETTTITATSYDADDKAIDVTGEQIHYTYTSSDPGVAIVDQTGKVTAVSTGTAVIRVEAEGSAHYDATAAETVIEVVKAELKLDAKAVSQLVYGGFSGIDTTAYDSAGNIVDTAKEGITYTYQPAGEKNVSVDKAGTIKATYAGTTTIKVLTGETKNYKAAQALITIEVVKADQQFTAALEPSPIYIGETAKIEIIGDTYGKLKYVSKKTKTAKVDSKGEVVCLKTGEVSFTVTAAGDDNHKPASYTFKVNIEKDNNATNNRTINTKIAAKLVNGKLKLTWGKVQKADGYEIYIADCGTNFPDKANVVIKKGKTQTATISTLNGAGYDHQNAYKVYVRAYRMVNKKKTYIARSAQLHVTGADNATRTNPKQVKVKKASFSLKKGKKATIQAAVIYQDAAKRPLDHCQKLRYWTMNPKIAAVNEKGVITAKGKGKTYVYVISENGAKKKIKVQVK